MTWPLAFLLIVVTFIVGAVIESRRKSTTLQVKPQPICESSIHWWQAIDAQPGQDMPMCKTTIMLQRCELCRNVQAVMLMGSWNLHDLTLTKSKVDAVLASMEKQ